MTVEATRVEYRKFGLTIRKIPDEFSQIPDEFFFASLRYKLFKVLKLLASKRMKAEPYYRANGA